MTFDRDKYYFDKSGDKLQYSGCSMANDGRLHYFRDERYVYHVNPKDILGIWEITDDPDRVYQTRNAGDMRLGDEWGSKNWGDELWHISIVQKILIKPRSSKITKCGCEVCEQQAGEIAEKVAAATKDCANMPKLKWCNEAETRRRLETLDAFRDKLKKILPLKNNDGRPITNAEFQMWVWSKINELVERVEWLTTKK